MKPSTEMGGRPEMGHRVGRIRELKHREMKAASALLNKHKATPGAEPELVLLLQDQYSSEKCDFHFGMVVLGFAGVFFRFFEPGDSIQFQTSGRQCRGAPPNQPAAATWKWGI